MCDVDGGWWMVNDGWLWSWSFRNGKIPEASRRDRGYSDSPVANR